MTRKEIPIALELFSHGQENGKFSRFFPEKGQADLQKRGVAEKKRTVLTADLLQRTLHVSDTTGFL